MTAARHPQVPATRPVIAPAIEAPKHQVARLGTIPLTKHRCNGKADLSERDDSIPSLKGPSFYGDTTPEMREAGGKALLAAAPELEGIVGSSSAKCIAAEIFRAMIKMKEEIADT
jgi:hypothetical protein